MYIDEWSKRTVLAHSVLSLGQAVHREVSHVETLLAGLADDDGLGAEVAEAMVEGIGGHVRPVALGDVWRTKRGY